MADPALAPVLANARRNADQARDAHRHPAQTLAFFQVRPGMTVVDYMPSGGWWTRILVPYLGDSGRYVGLNPDVSAAPAQMKQYFGNLAETLPAKAAEWTGVAAERVAAYNTDALPADLNGKVDRVLIFREMHNLWRMNMLHRELLAMRRLLKDDGLLGIEQHRARANAPASYTDGSKGYSARARRYRAGRGARLRSWPARARSTPIRAIRPIMRAACGCCRPIRALSRTPTRPGSRRSARATG